MRKCESLYTQRTQGTNDFIGYLQIRIKDFKDGIVPMGAKPISNGEYFENKKGTSSSSH